MAKVLIDLFRKGVTVIVSSLQLSSWAEPFEEMKEILPWATKIEICPAVCPITGRDAYYSFCKHDRRDGILVGGAESYEPRSFEHHKYVKFIEEIEQSDDATPMVREKLTGVKSA